MLCFDLMEMVGTEVEVVRQREALEKHKSTFQPALKELLEGIDDDAPAPWCWSSACNYNLDFDEKTIVPHLKWMGGRAIEMCYGRPSASVPRGEYIIFYNKTYFAPWWYKELAEAFEKRMENSPVLTDEDLY